MKRQAMQSIARKFGNRVRCLRKARGFCQEELADAIGVHRSLLAAIEDGKIDPTFATLYRLGLGLRVPMSVLLRGIETIPS